MKTYICELGCEEIPARFIPNLLQDAADLLAKEFKKEGLQDILISTMGTYRRLVIKSENLPETQPDRVEEIKGPPLRLCKNERGEWLPPALGFAKKVGVKVESLAQIEQGSESFLAFKRQIKGKSIEAVLAEIMPTVFKSMSLPIAMRWGNRKIPFIRPVRWVLSLCESDVVPFEFLDVHADRFSFGHRFLGGAAGIEGTKITCDSTQNFETLLEREKVIVSPKKRESIIREGLTKEMADADEDLINEVVYLTEYPQLLTGKFDEKYHEVPAEVLVQCMKKHQKYFPVLSQDTISNAFVFAAENVTAKSETNIIEGNQNVLRARLEDMYFFWKEGLKTPLEGHLNELKKVTYQKNMGSLYDKVTRIEKLSEALIKQLGITEKHKEIKQAAQLCKCDLVSQLVFEMPDLQGIAGRLIYFKQTGNNEVAQAIEEHYLPRNASDTVPVEIPGTIIAIADRLDTLVTTFESGHRPTGSQDPYGLRRAVFGIIKIALFHNLPLNLNDLIDAAYDYLGKTNSSKADLLDFIEQRTKSLLLEKLPDHQIIDTFLTQLLTHFDKGLGLMLEMLKLKQSNEDQLKSIIESVVRVSRLAKKCPKEAVFNPEKLIAKEEKNAWTTFVNCKDSLDPLTQSPATIFKTLHNYSEILTEYFDGILVMEKDESIKNNRLAFLREISNTFKAIGEFEKS